MDTFHTVTIEKLVFGGQGLARLSDGRAVFVWGALAGEEVVIQVTKRHKGVCEAIVQEVKVASPDRVEPRETTYLSTSPWQILSPEAEAHWKLETVLETYKKVGGLVLPTAEYVQDDRLYGYRNKMEFSFFTQTPTSPIELAFYERGKSWKQPCQGSALCEDVINTTAVRVRDWLRQEGVDRRQLKSLIVRSNGAGQAVAGLFVKEPLDVSAYPTLTDGLQGFHVFYSTPKSPASVVTDVLFTSGAEGLTARVGDVDLSFGLMSFFQVNVPLFERALERIREATVADRPVLDLYAGVGSIGLSLATVGHDVTLVESNAEAVAYATENAKGMSARVVSALSERATEYIGAEGTVIVDPPRAGLHADVVDALVRERPERVIYLSCNVATQARDLARLVEAYTVDAVAVFNFFPRTPHAEALVVLSRKSHL